MKNEKEMKKIRSEKKKLNEQTKGENSKMFRYKKIMNRTQKWSKNTEENGQRINEDEESEWY